MQEARSRILRLFPLNEDQTVVLDSILSSLTSSTPSSFHLVQGVFGSGKSYLIAAILIVLHSIHQASRVAHQIETTPDFLSICENPDFLSYSRSSPSSLTVLFCSHTNIAVDRVCLLLSDTVFHNFRRIGNIRKIHPQVRPYFRSNNNRSSRDAVSTTTISVDYIDTDGVNNDQSSVDIKITCSTICGLTSADHYDIVIIDEASQVYEYYALLPILQANPFIAVMIGDQNQLPPVPIGML